MFGYESDTPRDPLDVNWLRASVEVDMGPFHGATDATFQTHDFERFLSQLNGVMERKSHVAVFETMEEALSIRVETDRRGTATVSGTLRDIDIGASLSFMLISDPSFLQRTLGELRAVVSTFPDRSGNRFLKLSRLGLVLQPEDKDAALLLCRVNGSFALVHRPMTHGRGDIWMSFSPDLRDWGRHRPVLQARRGGWWDANKVGLSPPLIETTRGWLMLYHGVRQTASGSVYRRGAARLDLEQPDRCLLRSYKPIDSGDSELQNGPVGLEPTTDGL